MINCPNCEAELEENIKFCTKCGTKIEHVQSISQENDSEINCPSCSAKLPAETKFCVECGTKIEKLNSHEDLNQEIVCPECSAENPAGMRFCTDCGTKFDPAMKSQNDFVSEDTVETVKETGKGIMKEVGGLFNKATSKGGLFDKVSASIDDAVSPKTKTVYKKMLICENCGGYYELQKGESQHDFDLCECGGKFKYQLKQEKVPI